MPLVDVEFELGEEGLPSDVESFIGQAKVRIDQYQDVHPATSRGFVASDFVTVYRAMRVLADGGLGPCRSFCEWGSGFGVVASLAAMLGLEAHGIEIDKSLWENSVALARESGLPVNFVLGSFVPPGGEVIAEELYSAHGGEFFWLETNSDDAYQSLGLDPNDFDVIFAYPWPGEDWVIARLFDQFAAHGALLLTYVQPGVVCLRRKVGKPRYPASR